MHISIICPLIHVSIDRRRSTRAAARGLPVFEDLGSGNLFDFSSYGFMPEPTAQRVLASGVDVISFSGDKLLGGPQAGIIAGRAEYVERIRKNQLTRALRVDKMTLAALEATLRLYLDPELARSRVPTLNMITASAEDLRRKARTLRTRLTKLLDGLARVGTQPEGVIRKRTPGDAVLEI